MYDTYTTAGWFLLGSSALTGNVWDGKLSVFSDYEDYMQCPNLTMVACNTPSGINDALWYAYSMVVPSAVLLVFSAIVR